MVETFEHSNHRTNQFKLNKSHQGYKTLGTSVINIPIIPSSLIRFSYFHREEGIHNYLETSNNNMNVCIVEMDIEYMILYRAKFCRHIRLLIYSSFIGQYVPPVEGEGMGWIGGIVIFLQLE